MLEDLLQVALVVPLEDPTKDGCRMGVPVLLWGDPGIGKSSRIKSIGLRLGLYVGAVFPSGRLPEDFSGVPVQDGKGGLTLTCILTEIMKLKAIGEGTLFIDELNTARPATQDAIQSVVLDRRAGDVFFPPKLRIMAAANPTDLNAGAYALNIPLANRFCHLDLGAPTPDEWNNYIMGIEAATWGANIGDGERRVAKHWHEAWATARGEFVGFVKKLGAQFLHAVPEPGHPDRSKGFPTPRTMEMAARVTATCKALEVSGTIESRLLTGCIGQAATEAFLAYRIDQKLPSPADVIRDGFDPDKKRLDRSFAVYNALAAYVVSAPKEQQKKFAFKAWDVFAKGCEAGLGDLIYEPAKLLVNKDLGSLGGDDLAKACEPVIKRFNTAFQSKAKSIYEYNKRQNAGV